ncbi:DUF6527 family protein [Burkholderia vietnamiensis]|uniref:DUF6527 family protein n=1 Tax=Burkholderia vietnamiensis TaxID=60552 RepID=UPI0009BF0064|nr:DUF6527 family protein [Burkholderia vietnamiensis]
MTRITTLEHRFVRNVPRELVPGILYVSMDYATVVHSCCCGCGEQVVTPLSPTDWKMTYDGASVSLSPSIGNWQLLCRSHYVIRQGRVIEAGPWSAAQVAAEHRRDQAAKARFYGRQDEHERAEDGDAGRVVFEATPASCRSGNWWSSVVAWFSGSKSDK